MSPEVLDLLRLGIVGLLAGLFSHYLSGRRFVSERWWEQKASAYSGVIVALSEIQRYYSDMTWAIVREERDNIELTDERQQEIDAGVNAALRNLQKATNAGAFLLSRQAHVALRRYQVDDAPKGHHQVLHLTYCANSAQGCIDRIAELARQDLQRSAGPWPWWKRWPFRLVALSKRWLNRMKGGAGGTLST